VSGATPLLERFADPVEASKGPSVVKNGDFSTDADGDGPPMPKMWVLCECCHRQFDGAGQESLDAALKTGANTFDLKLPDQIAPGLYDLCISFTIGEQNKTDCQRHAVAVVKSFDTPFTFVQITDFHMGDPRAEKEFPGVDIRAVCDLLPDRGQGAALRIEQRAGRRAEVYAGSELIWQKLLDRADLDAVIIATPWDWHGRMAVAAMRAGKYPGVEVPAAITLRECWDLVHTSEQTGIPCMMLENVCYFQRVLTLLRMVREGVFGDVLHCEAGYQHDCRFLMF